MQTRTVLLVLFAVACGGSAAVGVSQLRRPESAPALTQTAPVVVATASVPRGALLSEQTLDVQRWPKEMVPPGVLSNLADAVERSVVVPLVTGEPVLEEKLASKGAGRGLASMIPSGMRAFTIETPHVAASGGGFILPGNRVDILMTTTSSGPNDRTGGGATTTLLQNVQVLAVAQRLDAPDDNRVDPSELKSVTLVVTPDQAAMLDLGMNKGKLHLSLRNPEDDLEADTLPATMAQLRFHQEPPQEFSPFSQTMDKVVGLVANMVQEGKAATLAPRKPPRTGTIRVLRGSHTAPVRVKSRE